MDVSLSSLGTLSNLLKDCYNGVILMKIIVMEGDVELNDDAGVGAVQVKYGQVVWAGQFMFDRNLLENLSDMEGKRFGSKSQFLETIALLLPLVNQPENLRNKAITIFCDNIGTVYSVKKWRSKSDPYTSLILQVIVILCVELNNLCFIAVNYIVIDCSVLYCNIIY